MCMICWSLFVLLSFFFWPLCCLFFFDLRILITSLWYLQTLFLLEYIIAFSFTVSNEYELHHYNEWIYWLFRWLILSVLCEQEDMDSSKSLNLFLSVIIDSLWCSFIQMCIYIYSVSLIELSSATEQGSTISLMVTRVHRIPAPQMTIDMLCFCNHNQ
jgi:hypothetical protein